MRHLDEPQPSQDTTLIEYFLSLSIEERFALNSRNAEMLLALMRVAGSTDDRIEPKDP